MRQHCTENGGSLAVGKVAYLTTGALSLAALAFPFSVAATNAMLAMALATGIFSGQWWQGAQYLWQDQRRFLAALGLYLLWLPLGLLWSPDIRQGLNVLGHHWFWLLLPLVVSALSCVRDRKIVLLCLSAGLALNLFYCVLQALGYVDVATDGSGMRDATGHIGHIGFGFVYALWAAWLLSLGMRWHGWQRWGCWGLSLWSCIMIFMAQGRAGYIMVVILFVSVMARWAWQDYRALRFVSIMGGVLLVLGLVLALGPGKERLAGPWQGWQGDTENDATSLDQQYALISTHQRALLLQASWLAWQEHPWLGTGTGGFVRAVKPMFEHSFHTTIHLSHPHNQYLLTMVRWGVMGLTCLLLLFFIWLQTGWKMDWHASATVPLIFLSGFALAIDGLFSITLEQHFSAILAILLLGAAFAAQYADGEV